MSAAKEVSDAKLFQAVLRKNAQAAQSAPRKAKFPAKKSTSSMIDGMSSDYTIYTIQARPPAMYDSVAKQANALAFVRQSDHPM